MPTPSAIFKGPDPARFPLGLVATKKSGQFRFAERVFYTQEVEGNAVLCPPYGQMFPRGSVWAIAGLNGYFWVEETIVEIDGSVGKVRTTFAWMGSVPPPEWSITPFEINPPLQRHPFFSGPNASPAPLSANDIQLVYEYFKVASAQGIAQTAAAIAASANVTLNQKLFIKLLQGKETWYQVGLKYVWTAFYTTLSGVNRYRGAFREDPLYSVSGAGPGSNYGPRNSIGTSNDTGWDWLREADEVVWANGLFKVTRTWLGAPGGFWDTDLYTTTPQ